MEFSVKDLASLFTGDSPQTYSSLHPGPHPREGSSFYCQRRREQELKSCVRKAYMLFKLSLFVPEPDLPVFWSLVLVYVMFGPATQPPSFTGMFVVVFQFFSNGYNKNKRDHMN